MSKALQRPRLPVLNRHTFSGAAKSSTPCLLSHERCQFTQSGRASIMLALELLGVGPGQSVMMPSYHCQTMIAPAVELGAQTIFYPLNADGFPDMARLDALASPDLRVILVAHYFGLPQDMAPIRAWCDARGVALIEDCAHSLFGQAGDRAVGRWGDLCIASLTKFQPVPEGGCLVLNRASDQAPQLKSPGLRAEFKSAYDIVHAAVNHGRMDLLRPFVQGLDALRRLHKNGTPAVEPEAPHDDLTTGGADEPVDLGRPHVAPTWASRWMSERAPRGRIVSRRREHYTYLARALADVPGMRPLRAQLPEHSAPYVFPLWVDKPDPGYLKLRRIGYPVSRWDWLWPGADQIADDTGPQWSRHVLQLACHQDLEPSELEWMVEVLKSLYVDA